MAGSAGGFSIPLDRTCGRMAIRRRPKNKCSGEDAWTDILVNAWERDVVEWSGCFYKHNMDTATTGGQLTTLQSHQLIYLHSHSVWRIDYVPYGGRIEMSILSLL